MRLFVAGRKKVFSILEDKLDRGTPAIWFHAASLGEYEQGVPVMEEVKKRYPGHQLVLTFFSPSGYEIKKNNALAKAATYLPLDTPSNVRRFLDMVNPEMVFFIKYEFWPNYLMQLKHRNIRTFLLSGVFREGQSFFKWYGKWMTPSLTAFEYFFLQNQASSNVLSKLGFKNQEVCGDTRFDRVSHQIEMNNSLDFVQEFKNNALCVVCGSTWPEDENVLIPFIHDHKGAAQFIIAPHEIKLDKISVLKEKLKNIKAVLFSEREGKDLKAYDVLILDTIGLLAKVYSYADIAYIGGAMGTTGLHNILEPATFGIPILTGAHLDKFPEAIRLRQLAGLYTIKDAQELNEILSKLLSDKKFRTQTGMIAGHFVNSNTGATASVMEYLAKTS
jgi:3-deoxy-D-manno-octulosonic-acid transferase